MIIIFEKHIGYENYKYDYFRKIAFGDSSLI